MKRVFAATAWLALLASQEAIASQAAQGVIDTVRLAPEPSGFLAFACGLAGLWGVFWRRKRRTHAFGMR